MQSSFNRELVPKASLFHFVLLCWIHVSRAGTVFSLLEGYLGHITCQLLYLLYKLDTRILKCKAFFFLHFSASTSVIFCLARIFSFIIK